MAVFEIVPTSFVAGDTLRFTISVADYPAPTWDLTFYAESGAGSFSQASVDDGTSHSFTIPASTTAGIATGRYFWRIRATDGTIVETVADLEGWIEAHVNPAAPGNRDMRSQARKLLDAVQATLENRATDGQLAMSIAGRSISRIPLKELLEWEQQLKAQVAVEEGGVNVGIGRNLYVRYSPP